MKIEKCRICSNSKFKYWGKKDGYKLYQCLNCELVFFYPYPTQDFLNDLYNNQDYHKNRGYSGDTNAGILRKKMYELDVADIENKIKLRGKFLDVGCAEGQFLATLSNEWDKYGIDASKTALSSARENLVNINFVDAEINQIPFDEDYFDVVHLRGVFEHILEPSNFVVEAIRVLKKGGYLVFSNTPNIGSLCARLYKGRFKLVLVNEHVNYFSLNTMKFLASKYGLTIEAVTYPYFGTPYASIIKDSWHLVLNYFTAKESPPYWGNIFTIYMKVL